MPTPLDRIIPLYRKRVLQRAKENEAALRASGAYSPAEFNDLKDRMLKAYRNVGMASAPVMNTNLSNLKKFLKSGEYRNLGSTGVTNGKNDLGARLRYSNAVYGYEDLPGAEKYGTVPMDELSGKADESRMSRGVVPGSEYGETRARNEETLSLLEGRKPYEYIEAHVHGPITRDDVDFVETLSWYNSHEAFQNIANRYNVRFIPASEYSSSRPLDARRELEPRPRKVEDWTLRLRR